MCSRAKSELYRHLEALGIADASCVCCLRSDAMMKAIRHVEAMLEGTESVVDAKQRAVAQGVYFLEACRRKSHEDVQLFLDYGLAAPRFLSTPFPLSLAVQRCDVRIVQVLLNAHIKVDYDVYLGVYSPLPLACQMIAHSIYADCSCFGPVDNIIEIAELLVAKGADFDAEDEDGLTPLEILREHGDFLVAAKVKHDRWAARRNMVLLFHSTQTDLEQCKGSQPNHTPLSTRMSCCSSKRGIVTRSKSWCCCMFAPLRKQRPISISFPSNYMVITHSRLPAVDRVIENPDLTHMITKFL